MQERLLAAPPKVTSGNQRYEVRPKVKVGRYDTVLIWCRAFSVPVAAADVSSPGR
ncbi:MAG: DM13 domain-containing protein [Solirubrobacterales bacterium]|nr:DM13 domain-containing protein [Solirubrobacterales bacterium]